MKKIISAVSVFLLLSINIFSAVISSTLAGGNWSLTTTWAGGVVPLPTDDATIVSGATVNLTTNQSITNVIINGTGILNMNSARTLTVSGNFTMNNTSAVNGNLTTAVINIANLFSVPLGASTIVQNISLNVTGTSTIAGTLTQNSGNSAAKTFGNLTISGTWTNTASNVPITISGNLINNGTFNQGNGRVTFTGSANNTISGTAALTTFAGGISVTKGVLGTAADQNNILDVQCVITINNGGLDLNNGTFKLSSASTFVPFTVDPAIPVSSRLWNNGGTMNSNANFNWSLDGTIQNSLGTINFGTALGNRIAPGAGGTGVITISGGSLTCTGRISSGTNGWTYNMSGGTLLLGTIGNNTAGFDVFNMDNSTCSFSMSGGIIIIERSGGAAGENLGYHNYGTVGTGFTGGTLQMGDASTPSNNIMRIETDIPIYNLTVNSANLTAQLQSELVVPFTTQIAVTNNVTITDGVLDASNQNFLVGGNWTNTSSIADPLTEGVKLITLNGTAAQTISNTGNVNGTTFYDLTFNNSFAASPQIILDANSVAEHTLTMTLGKVNLNSSILTLGTGNTVALAGTLSYTSGWLFGGTFKRWFSTGTIALANARGLFPMGTSNSNTKDYRPVWVTYSGTALTSGGTVSVIHNPVYPSWHTTVNYVDATWGGGGTTVQGISNSSWAISSANGFAFNGASGELRFGGTGFNAFVLTDLNASLVANAVGTFGAATSVNVPLEVNRTALTTVFLNNTWYIGTKNINQSPLPIELLDFTATPENNYVQLYWTTATETNNNYFTVEKCKDGINFEQVIIVAGAGNSETNLHYHTTDETPYDGLSYYRLKQTDFNENFTYSDLVPVTFNNVDFTVNVFPNPVSENENTIIDIHAAANENVFVVITDADGKEIFSKSMIIGTSGEFIFTLDAVQKPAAGIYFISASMRGLVCHNRFIVR